MAVLYRLGRGLLELALGARGGSTQRIARIRATVISHRHSVVLQPERATIPHHAGANRRGRTKLVPRSIRGGGHFVCADAGMALAARSAGGLGLGDPWPGPVGTRI